MNRETERKKYQQDTELPTQYYMTALVWHLRRWWMHELQPHVIMRARTSARSMKEILNYSRNNIWQIWRWWRQRELKLHVILSVNEILSANTRHFMRIPWKEIVIANHPALELLEKTKVNLIVDQSAMKRTKTTVSPSRAFFSEDFEIALHLLQMPCTPNSTEIFTGAGVRRQWHGEYHWWFHWE